MICDGSGGVPVGTSQVRVVWVLVTDRSHWVVMTP